MRRPSSGRDMGLKRDNLIIIVNDIAKSRTTGPGNTAGNRVSACFEPRQARLRFSGQRFGADLVGVAVVA